MKLARDERAGVTGKKEARRGETLRLKRAWHLSLITNRSTRPSFSSTFPLVSRIYSRHPTICFSIVRLIILHARRYEFKKTRRYLIIACLNKKDFQSIVIETYSYLEFSFRVCTISLSIKKRKENEKENFLRIFKKVIHILPRVYYIISYLISYQLDYNPINKSCPTFTVYQTS